MTPESIREAERALAWMYGATTADVTAAIEAVSHAEPTIHVEVPAEGHDHDGFAISNDELASIMQAHTRTEPRKYNLNPRAGARA